MTLHYKLFTAGLPVFFACTYLYAQPIIDYQSIVTTGLVDPIDIAIPPNASPANGSTRLYLAQQNGTIQVWNGSALSTVLNITTNITTGGERGLLSMAFHPSYNGVSNRFFYVFYTDGGGDLAITRYRTDPGNPLVVETGSGVNVITPIEHSARTNHNGGDLNFGPDGFLYLSTGDGGGSGDPDENAQNPASLLGKILRIDVDGVLPATPQVVDIGLRNPFRWSFDKTTGDAWIGDVGQGNWEEISFRPAGAGTLNFGWDCFEGPAVFESTGCPGTGFTPPAYSYRNPDDGRSVVGGYVYRGTEYPALQGYYLATDYFSGTIFKRSPGGTWFAQSPALQNGIAAFGEAPDGTLYAVSQFSDALYKVIFSSVLPVRLASFSGNRTGSKVQLQWLTTAEQNTARFLVQFSGDGTRFADVGTVPASRRTNGHSYAFTYEPNRTGNLFFRLAVVDDDGSVTYSSVLKLAGEQARSFKLYPTIVSNRMVTVESGTPLNTVRIINSNGITVYTQQMNRAAGIIQIPLPQLPAGNYLLQASGPDVEEKAKLIIR